MIPYQRPIPDDTAQKSVLRTVGKFFHNLNRQQQVQVLTAILIENTSLTAEVNEHRQARGIEPLPTYEAKL